jgi:sugar/nucleoside kinase (ribokinase family)
VQRPTFVTVGGIVADLVVPIHSFPITPQVHQVVERFSVEPGGLGNCLVVAARLGMHAVALGWVGRDIFGDHVSSSLRQEEVDVDQVLRLPGRSTVSCVLVDREGQHVFVGSMGVRGPDRLPDEWDPIIGRAPWVMSDGWVLVQNPDPIEDAIVRAHAYGRTVVFDPGPLLHRVPDERIARVLAATTVLLLTEEEAVRLGESGSPEQLAKTLLTRGPSIVALKRGVAGALIMSQSESFVQPAFPVTVRDTTGAGDAFDAAFIAGLAFDLPLRSAAALAAAAGAVAVSKLGTGTAMPTREEISAFIAAHRLGLTLPPAHPSAAQEV